MQCGKCNTTQYRIQTIGPFELKLCASCGGLMQERRDRRERDRESPAMETEDTGCTLVPVLDG